MENDLLQLQSFKESTWGTPGACTAKLMGIQNVVFKPNVEAAVHKDRRASFQPGQMSNVRQIDATAMIESLLLYEDAALWWDMLCAIATPSGSGPYTRDYAMPDGSAPTIRTLSMIYGETGTLQRIQGATLQKATFKFPRTGECTLSMDFIAEQVEDGGALAALSDRATNVVMAADMSLFIDLWGGTIGSTAFSGAWFAQLVVDSRRELKHGPGSLYPLGYRHRRFEAALTLHLEVNAASLALQAAVEAATAGAPVQRQVRVSGTRDSSAALKLHQVDFAGTFLNASEAWNDEDGLSFVTFELGATYHATLANSLKAQLKSSLSAVP